MSRRDEAPDAEGQNSVWAVVAGNDRNPNDVRMLKREDAANAFVDLENTVLRP
jgi:hypothetical protein